MSRTTRQLPRLAAGITAATLTTTLLLPVAPSPASTTAATAAKAALPLGVSSLTEVRSTQTLAPGVGLTSIVRGTEPASSKKIGTTTHGPWRVHVLSIDPAVATGGLRATYGPDLARVEKTSSLVRSAGGLIGVNASYFTFSSNPDYPGDQVGLSVGGGVVLSEPEATSTEVDLLVDSATNAVRLGRLSWSGSMRNTTTDAKLALEFVNHPPVVPKSCRKLDDPTDCTSSGDVVLFTREFGPTPSGPGLEVVLDQDGCVVKVRNDRGRTLKSGQSAVQATGKQAASLKSLTKKGCLKRSVKLTDSDDNTVKLTKTTYGVAGRYWLVRRGKVQTSTKTDAYHARAPRTFAGTTKNGTIQLVTIDGRRTTSVGTTFNETAAVALSLGLRDAVNLDGGGSTAMALATGLVSTPSGSSERAVGDALVYVP